MTSKWRVGRIKKKLRKLQKQNFQLLSKIVNLKLYPLHHFSLTKHFLIKENLLMSVDQQQISKFFAKRILDFSLLQSFETRRTSNEVENAFGVHQHQLLKKRKTQKLECYKKPNVIIIDYWLHLGIICILFCHSMWCMISWCGVIKLSFRFLPLSLTSSTCSVLSLSTNV